MMMDTMRVVRQLNMNSDTSRVTREDTFHQVVEDGMRSVVNEVFAVIIRNYLGVLWKHHRIQLVYLGFDGLYHLRGILPLSHDHDGLHDVVLVDDGTVARGIDGIGPADPSQAGHIGDLNVRHVFYQHRDIIIGGDDDVLDLVDIV